MELHQVLHMNGGEAELSYAKNSSHQKLVLMKAKPVLEKCIEELMSINLHKSLNVADLGCSSGPNTLLTMLEIIQSIDKACRKLNHEPPMIQFFLNDLIGNDFDSVFKSLPSFYEKLEKENGRQYGSCLVAATPGSFYGRLFPKGSLDFAYSSYGVHWLSQVPEGLVTESGTPNLNKGNIYITKTTPACVHQAYLNQFTKDLTKFLRLRSEEMVPHGHLLLTLVGKGDEDDGSGIVELIGMALNDMILEGYVEEEKLDSFNIPQYLPTVDELRNIIQNEGSFRILNLEIFKLRYDASFYPDDNQGLVNDEYDSKAAFVARYTRAVYEPILATHFGEAIMDDLFHSFAKHAAEVLQMGKVVFKNLVISLAKRQDSKR